MEAVDELAGVAVGIVAGDVEKRLRERQRGAQFVGGIGRESLLFGYVRFEPGEHGVEGVREFAELVLTSFQLDSVGERSTRGHACGVGDVSQGSEHAAGEKPPSQQTEYQQERHRDGGDRSEIAQEVGVAAHHEDHARVHTTREGEVPGGEQYGTCEHEEAGVAEGELEANAQTGGSIHGLLPQSPASGCVSIRYPTPATVAMIPGSPRRLRSPETVMRTAFVNGSAFSSHACARSSSAPTTPPSAATRTSSTANCFLVSAT